MKWILGLIKRCALVSSGDASEPPPYTSVFPVKPASFRTLCVMSMHFSFGSVIALTVFSKTFDYS
jgi:hypothetical protein